VSALPNFRIETIEARSGITIKLGGELDSATCVDLVSHFEQRAPARGVPDLVLDLSEVSFIDSSGMRAIILIERSAGERGFSLTILPPPGALTDLLQVTGIADSATLAPQAGASPTAPFVERIELELPREPTAPARARAELREAFGGRLGDGDRGTITLLTSELVTNAVIHPAPGVGGSIGLRITAYPDRVRVEVRDAGAGFDAGNLPPRLRRERGGHGLVVVDGLSSQWGTRQLIVDDREGFCVWFELEVAYDLRAASDATEPDEREVATAEG
jgi:anti-sigma B factor antagonist